MTPLDRFTQDDLIAQLGMETVAKGLGYLSRVSALSAEGSEVSALVKGRQRTPYDVFADVTEADGRPTLVSKCTCPMGYDCKHVAAMMLLLFLSVGLLIALIYLVMRAWGLTDEH